MSRWRGCGLLWLAAGLACAAAPLRIATYNVENYGPANRMTEAGYRQDYPKSEAAKAALRAVIRATAADVLVLQEMGGPAYLEELRRDLAAEGLRYVTAYVLEAADEDRHIALLAKLEPRAIIPHRELTFRYQGRREPVKRGVLEVRLPVPGGDVTVWAVHLKSRYTDRADDPASALRRTGEAGAIRDLILSQAADPTKARCVILGDFNDVKASAPVRAFLHRGSQTIAELLPAVDSRGETWTYTYAKEDSFQRVDHILVSPGLKSCVADSTARIVDSPETRQASDHRPVVVTLECR